MSNRTNEDDLRGALAGVAVASVTPFEDDGTVSTERLRSHVTWMVERGIRVVIPNGNTGEFHSLTRDEWSASVKAAVSGSQGQAHVIPAVGGSFDDALGMVKEAGGAGVSGIMVLPLHHTYTSSEGVERYLEGLLTATTVPLIAYVKHIAHLEPTLRLASHAKFIGVKFAIPDVSLFSNAVAQTEGTGVVWSCGIAEQWAPFFAMGGATGFTSGIANFAPELPLAMHRAIAEDDWRTAMTLRAAAVPFELLRSHHANAYNVPAVKAAMNKVGLHGGTVRPPLTNLTETDLPTLDEAVGHVLAAVGAVPDEPA